MEHREPPARTRETAQDTRQHLSLPLRDVTEQFEEAPTSTTSREAVGARRSVVHTDRPPSHKPSVCKSPAFLSAFANQTSTASRPVPIGRGTRIVEAYPNTVQGEPRQQHPQCIHPPMPTPNGSARTR